MEHSASKETVNQTYTPHQSAWKDHRVYEPVENIVGAYAWNDSP